MLNELKSERNIPYLRIVVVFCFILFAAIVRILPHPWNFAPVGAMALFAGAKLGPNWKAFLFPLVALFAGDLFIGFYSFVLIVYASFCLSVLIGAAFRNRQSAGPLALATLLGATQFFLISNAAVWAFGTTYAKTPAGLASCYVAGIPYFGNTLAGDAFYAVVLFGGYALIARLLPGLRENRQPAVA